jgi:hypothetical protein
MPIDPPFNANDAWWPGPGRPQNGPLGGPPYPDYWNDPFINSRAVAPATPAPFSAAQLGAMAWHPPIFPGDWARFFASAAPTSKTDLTTAPGWPYPQSLFSSLAQPPASNGLFSRDPSLSVGGGLFPYPIGSDPDPTSPFGSGLFSGRPAASAPMSGMPGASSAPGWAASLLAPFAQLQDPFATGAPALDSSSSLRPGSTDSAATPTSPPRSVLFNRPQPDWDLGPALMARERNAAALDSVAQGLGADGLPLSKSGVPYVSPAPQLSFEPPQWLDVARLLAPNTVDYFTKPLPPTPPFPPTPGKIPSEDNPYALGAALEVLSLLPLGLEGAIAGPLGRAAAGVAERGAGELAAKVAAEAPALTRAGENIVTGPYGKLSGKLPEGWQAHHLNQNAVYRGSISRNEGFSVGMEGDIIAQPGTPHYLYHRSMEQFWGQYREGGSLEHSMPTNAEYGEASRHALIASGLSAAQASDLAAQAAAQRVARGLSESAEVPRLPKPIWRSRRD